MKKNLLILCALFVAMSAFAQDTLTVAVPSKKMGIDIKNTIILPSTYTKDKEYPVLYLLHGHGGSNTTWMGTKNTLVAEATKYEMIIVCPDAKNSWYWDSPNEQKSQYDTFVSNELISYIDTNYSTIKSPKGRAITGLSMGGHGGLWLGINHPDVFGACGSMSGGVDITPFPNNWNMKDQLGGMKENKKRWDEHTVINQLHKIEPYKLDIIIDCGYEDFFFEVNEKLHEKMLYLNIKHDYITRPGGHTREYWENAIDYQLVFFNKFFKRSAEAK